MQLFQAIDIIHPVSGEVTRTLIFALVKYVHVCKDVLDEPGVPDITKGKPIARSGDVSFVILSSACIRVSGDDGMVFSVESLQTTCLGFGCLAHIP